MEWLTKWTHKENPEAKLFNQVWQFNVVIRKLNIFAKVQSKDS